MQIRTPQAMKQAERNHRAGTEIRDDLMALVFPPSSRRMATAKCEFPYCQDTDQLVKGQLPEPLASAASSRRCGSRLTSIP
jgi:hypothetical protein